MNLAECMWPLTSTTGVDAAFFLAVSCTATAHLSTEPVSSRLFCRRPPLLCRQCQPLPRCRTHLPPLASPPRWCSTIRRCGSSEPLLEFADLDGDLTQSVAEADEGGFEERSVYGGGSRHRAKIIYEWCSHLAECQATAPSGDYSCAMKLASETGPE